MATPSSSVPDVTCSTGALVQPELAYRRNQAGQPLPRGYTHAEKQADGKHNLVQIVNTALRCNLSLSDKDLTDIQIFFLACTPALRERARQYAIDLHKDDPVRGDVFEMISHAENQGPGWVYLPPKPLRETVQSIRTQLENRLITRKNFQYLPYEFSYEELDALLEENAALIEARNKALSAANASASASSSAPPSSSSSSSTSSTNAARTIRAVPAAGPLTTGSASASSSSSSGVLSAAAAAAAAAAASALASASSSASSSSSSSSSTSAAGTTRAVPAAGPLLPAKK